MSVSALARLAVSAALIALVVVGIARWVGRAAPLQSLEGRSVDWRFLFRGPRPVESSDVAVVLIQDEAELPYRSPIPRGHLADIIDRLGEARLVGLDILLDRPSSDAAADARLIDALRRHGRVVGVSYLQGGAEHGPQAAFADAMKAYGYANFPTDRDAQIVRRGTAWRRVEDGVVLSLAGCLRLLDQGVAAAALRVSGTTHTLPRGPVLIDFTGPPSQVSRSRGDLPAGIAVCPSHLVTAGVYPPDFFAGKVVFVGSGLSDAPDRFRTPFFGAAYDYALMYGVEIHAQLFRTLSAAPRLRVPADGAVAALLGGIVWAMGLVVLRRGTLWGSAYLGLSLLALWSAGFALFEGRGLVLPLVVPTLGLSLGYGTFLAGYGLTEGRQRRQTRRLFEKYLSPAVIADLLDQPDRWSVGGRRADLSVMFADLEGFTPLGERLPPEQLVALVNDYLTEMTGIILDEGGTIDKYEGDLVMAFFGAPLPQDDHAGRACRAALGMQRRMATLRREWAQRGRPQLRVRIGISSGEAVVGNMGSDLRFDYTVMGRTVNLAARLEPANKELGTSILVSEETRRRAAGDFAFRALGRITVKGVREAVDVFELMGNGDGRPPT